MITRRTFCAVATTALSQSRILGANDRIRLGLIGCGGRGTQLWDTFLGQPGVEPVAACDVYEPFLNRAITNSRDRAKPYSDFRQLLEQKDIDVVIIATPDHWHALMAVAACDAGKDVYCEAPLSLTLGEGRYVVNAARRNNRIVQVGNVERSAPHYDQAVKMIQEGAIGELARIHIVNKQNARPGFTAKEILTNTPPRTLDWDLWLGPAPEIAFDPFRCIYNFRWFWDYSGGQMTSWGAPQLDIARWIMADNDAFSATGFGGRYGLEDSGETPDVQEVSYTFSKGLITWSSSEISTEKGYTFDVYGSRGTISLSRNGYTFRQNELQPDGTYQVQPEIETLKVMGSTLDDSHVRNFLDCVRSRQKPNADVEEGNRSAIMCHLGNLSMRLERPLRWDTGKEQIFNDADANRWLTRPYRGNWKLA